MKMAGLIEAPVLCHPALAHHVLPAMKMAGLIEATRNGTRALSVIASLPAMKMAGLIEARSISSTRFDIVSLPAMKMAGLIEATGGIVASQCLLSSFRP